MAVPKKKKNPDPSEKGLRNYSHKWWKKKALDTTHHLKNHLKEENPSYNANALWKTFFFFLSLASI